MKPLTFSLRQLASGTLELRGELSPVALDINGLDELVQVGSPVEYDLAVEQAENDLLVQGRVVATLDCQCSRCLKSFKNVVTLDPFVLELELEGEEAISTTGDLVDLTPYLREDILLAFPQHPLCEIGCVGLQNKLPSGTEAQPGSESQSTSSPWAILNELKL